MSKSLHHNLVRILKVNRKIWNQYSYWIENTDDDEAESSEEVEDVQMTTPAVKRLGFS